MGARMPRTSFRSACNFRGQLGLTQRGRHDTLPMNTENMKRCLKTLWDWQSWISGTALRCMVSHLFKDLCSVVFWRGARAIPVVVALGGMLAPQLYCHVRTSSISLFHGWGCVAAYVTYGSGWK